MLSRSTDGGRGETIAEIGIDDCERERRFGNGTVPAPDEAPADIAREARDVREI